MSDGAAKLAESLRRVLADARDFCLEVEASAPVDRPTRVVGVRDAPAGWRSRPEFVALAGQWVCRSWPSGNDAERRRVEAVSSTRVLDNVWRLRGRVLVCPRNCERGRCRGDVLAELADGPYGDPRWARATRIPPGRRGF